MHWVLYCLHKLDINKYLKRVPIPLVSHKSQTPQFALRKARTENWSVQRAKTAPLFELLSSFTTNWSVKTTAQLAGAEGGMGMSLWKAKRKKGKRIQLIWRTLSLSNPTTKLYVRADLTTHFNPIKTNEMAFESQRQSGGGQGEKETTEREEGPGVRVCPLQIMPFYLSPPFSRPLFSSIELVGPRHLSIGSFLSFALSLRA